MTKTDRRQIVLASCFLVAFFSVVGCSSGQQTRAVPPLGASPPRYADSTLTQPYDSTTLIYVADHFNNKIRIYTHTLGRAGPPMNNIDVPAGLAIDASRNVYVTNEREKKVRAYHPGANTPFRVIRLGLTEPTFMVLGNGGALYVSDPGTGTVVEYARGSDTPTSILNLPSTNGMPNPEGLALDSSNNLFVAYNDDLAGHIQKFKPGATSGTDTGITVQAVGGITFDKAGNMIVTDQIAPAVLVYPPGSSTPSNTVNLDFTDPFGIAFNSAQTQLYLTDAGGSIYDIAYPQWTVLHKIPVPYIPWGVAVSPRAPH